VTEVPGDRARLLIVGLGNPGRRYAGTRHNVGFDLVDRLADAWRTSFAASSGVGPTCEIALAVVGRTDVVLMKPLTYMNRVGLVVGPFAAEHRLDAGECLAVVDDMALPVGRIRFRPRGSAGGHNGLSSIEERLGTSDYPRLRIGIGPATLIESGIERAMSEFNG
jgi:PTH1 family peptidyl-tRNA hydrolase